MQATAQRGGFRVGNTPLKHPAAPRSDLDQPAGADARDNGGCSPLSIVAQGPSMSFSRTSEPIRLERECAAVMVPHGTEVVLPAGQVGYITQALGGSFTVYVDGNLFRISGEDADALGKERPPPLELAEDAGDADVEKLIWQQLRTCFDPEIPINIVDLGLVYDCVLEHLPDGNRRVEIRMTLTAPGCGMGDILVADVQEKLALIPTVTETDVELVFDPPWNQTMMSDEARLETGMMY